jgi:hypothetical protein
VELTKIKKEPKKKKYRVPQGQSYDSVNRHALLIVRNNSLRICVHTCTYELGLAFRNLNICK